MTKLVSIVLLAVFGCACSKTETGDKAVDKPADKPVDKPAAEQVDMEAKSIELMGKLVNVYEAAGTDCDKLVADLKKFTVENRDAMIAQNAWKAQLTSDEKAALDTKYATLKPGKKMMAAAQACGDRADLAAVLNEMPLR